MYPTDTLDEEGYDHGHTHGRREPVLEHPCLALRKLLSGGSFYYSADFDLTSRLQDRERYVQRRDVVGSMPPDHLNLHLPSDGNAHTIVVHPVSPSTSSRSTKATYGTRT